MIIHRAHKIELIVNEKQELYLKKAVGCARFAFNWALNEWIEEYEAYKKDPTHPKPNQYSIRRKLNAIKREQFPWMMDVTKCAVQMGIIQLGKAFANFWKNPENFKYPKFKRSTSVIASLSVMIYLKSKVHAFVFRNWVGCECVSRCDLKERKFSGQRSRGAANAGT